MDWSAAHADYVIAAYAIAFVIILGCVFFTWRGK